VSYGYDSLDCRIRGWPHWEGRVGYGEGSEGRQRQRKDRLWGLEFRICILKKLDVNRLFFLTGFIDMGITCSYLRVCEIE
jgi:hypothetical protein